MASEHSYAGCDGFCFASERWHIAKGAAPLRHTD